MECDRLERLVKSWYFQVQDEALAPARMVSFINKHLDECPICITDPMVKQEVQKIIEIVLPPAKARKPNDETEKEDEEETAEASSEYDGQDTDEEDEQYADEDDEEDEEDEEDDDIDEDDDDY